MLCLTSAGSDVAEAMLQVPPQDVGTPGAVGAGAEEGPDPLLLPHAAGPRAGAPRPPLSPRAVPERTEVPFAGLASIWEQG